jgi:hypothetical protein
VQRVLAGRPHHFVFDALKPDRPYTVWLEGLAGAEQRGRAGFRTLPEGGCRPSCLAMAMLPQGALPDLAPRDDAEAGEWEA